MEKTINYEKDPNGLLYIILGLLGFYIAEILGEFIVIKIIINIISSIVILYGLFNID